jgi:hypothetical protein
MPETVFASARNWTPVRINAACRQHGVGLTDRGEVILAGEVVGSYELAGGVLVIRDIAHDSPLVGIFDLRQVQ